jgi:hypothetical protein
MCRYRRVWGLALMVLFLGACATPAYKDVFKDKPAYNSRSFSANQDILYQATLRAICGRNFIIEEEDQGKGVILAKRSFQRGKRTIVLVLQANASLDAAGKTTLFLNALETTERHYVADRTRFFLWLVPLPGGGGKQGESVKEGERIIEDKTFYQNFFVEIQEEAERLTQIAASQKRDEDISVAVQAPNIIPEKESAEKIIIKEAVAPQMSPSEDIASEAVLRPEGSDLPGEAFHEITTGEGALPVEENVTDSSR